MEQCTRFYILLHTSTTSSFSPILFPLFVAFFADPGLAVSVALSPFIIVPVSFASVLGNLVTVSHLSVMTDSVILIPSSVPRVNVVVLGDVYGAVVTGGGHVNVPTFLELQIRSLTEVENVFRVCIARYKHERGWENSRQLCKPETKVWVCITVETKLDRLNVGKDKKKVILLIKMYLPTTLI